MALQLSAHSHMTLTELQSEDPIQASHCMKHLIWEAGDFILLVEIYVDNFLMILPCFCSLIDFRL